ncbi:MAG: ATP-binding protein [Deltaproteobacteria bacterium]|nr:ATP-binding protein [Deltaproteobacteria bacterium]
MKVRYLAEQIKRDLKQKMVFIAGPRQIGKTTLALSLLKKNEGYLSWDIPEQRERILKRQYPNAPLIVFDEIHKFRAWRNYLKGFYDDKKSRYQILVTGSAKLDYYRFGGDSLQGRYHLLRMHPLSSRELGIDNSEDLMALLDLSGFPEPYFGQSKEAAKRWSTEYRTRLVEEEITSLEAIRDVGSIELLMLRLPELVGSPLSINSLREDLQVNHYSVSKWIDILERNYVLFRLSPFGASKIRAVKKEQKHYHYDWSLVENLSYRFENMVACHLLKWVCFEQDAKGRELDLNYFRDVDKREVDFVITEKRTPIFFVECKWSDAAISPGLLYLKNKFPQVESWQISMVGNKDYLSRENIRVSPAIKFLKKLI